MSALAVTVLGAEPDRTAMVPILRFDLRVAGPDDLAVQSMLLRCQIRVEPEQRRYADGEAARVEDLFGGRERWAETLRAFPLAHVTLPVGRVEGAAEVSLPVELSYDLEVTAGKYLHALRDGEVPLLFLFSGTVYAHEGGRLSVRQIPWDVEARYRLPVSVWRDLMDLHFPGMGWLRLHRETIDALTAYKARHALPTWDDTVRHLLGVDQEVSP